ncbi:MAG TPA: rhomboid family intramembrane serine protease [Xanthomonadaceae bacterium]|nr:rhomboid family intramembrane serine protease [Xanthomonadaceae bacterium]
MDLPDHDLPATPVDLKAQQARDRRRLRRSFWWSAGFVLLLMVVFSAQDAGAFDWRAWTVQPWSLAGLAGLIGAPLLHGSGGHLAANSMALVFLGTLAGSVYPRATLPSLPLLWLGSGLGAWLLGAEGSYHLGASGVTHGLGFLVFTLGVLRRDRAAIAAACIAFFLYGGMLLTVLPREAGISWESHLGGAVAGVLCAIALRARDPLPPRKRYSWELEEELEAEAAREARDQFEPGRPDDVPVLWQRDTREEERGTVLPFPSRD